LLVTDSLVAVICALPGATAVTSPDAETVATVFAADVHVTVRVSAAPAASRGVAASCTVRPTISDAFEGVIVSDDTTAGGGGGGGGGGGSGGATVSLPPHEASATVRKMPRNR
jgi:hypothetical protein